MDSETAREEAELIAAFSAQQTALRRWLTQAFRRLGDEADDILQEAVTETVRRLRTEGFRPQVGWIGYLRTVARHRAIDRLRSWEFRLFQRLGTGGAADEADPSAGSAGDRAEPAEQRPGPPTQLLEAERRSRQGLLLSEVLEEFSRWCESRPNRLAIKEAYERSLRGQPPAAIAAGLGLAPGEVYTLLNRAREWVFQRVRQADVDRSVFLTLHRRKGE